MCSSVLPLVQQTAASVKYCIHSQLLIESRKRWRENNTKTNFKHVKIISSFHPASFCAGEPGLLSTTIVPRNPGDTGRSGAVTWSHRRSIGQHLYVYSMYNVKDVCSVYIYICVCVCIVNKYSVYIYHVCVLYLVSDSSRWASMVKRHLELIARSSNFAFNSGSKQTPGAFDLLGRRGIELSKKKTPERHEAFGSARSSIGVRSSEFGLQNTPPRAKGARANAPSGPVSEKRNKAAWQLARSLSNPVRNHSLIEFNNRIQIYDSLMLQAFNITSM